MVTTLDTNVTFDMNTTIEDIKLALQNNTEPVFVVRLITEETLVFDMTKTSSNVVAQTIMDKINTVKTELDEMMTADEDYTGGYSEDELEEMYQAWLAEQENRYDAEDAMLHHYCA